MAYYPNLKKRPISERCAWLYENLNGELEFIAGKWFLKKQEIKQIDKFISKIDKIVTSAEDIRKIKEFYRIRYGNEVGKWYDLPIIKEAEELIANNNLKPLAYPLNEKQLIIINYLLRHDEEVCFILTGVGGSGKSTFANIICQVFDNDKADISLSELSHDFKLAEAIDKRLIYSTEIDSDEINSGKIKQLISNECLTINPKHETPYQARCQSALFFNCNVNPKLNLSDTGMLRRFLYYAMNEKIKNPDKTLNKKEYTHEDLVNIVAHALSVDMTDWRKKFEKETRLNLLKGNSVYKFREYDKYESYKEKCLRATLKPFSETKWSDIRKLMEEWNLIKLTIIEDDDDPIF
ncbi:MAG: hypothetical protein J6Q58_01920 [Clostridia bacterium]|nr:hypothetical protein [Clostridia bacterium]